MRPSRIVIVLTMLSAASAGWAEIYAYVNDDGDYVITRDKPGRGVGEYAVLTDDGEFLRLIRPRDRDVPISHWRPWFLPRQPDPYDADEEAYEEREGVVGVEELEPERRASDENRK